MGKLFLKRFADLGTKAANGRIRHEMCPVHADLRSGDTDSVGIFGRCWPRVEGKGMCHGEKRFPWEQCSG